MSETPPRGEALTDPAEGSWEHVEETDARMEDEQRHDPDSESGEEDPHVQG